MREKMKENKPNEVAEEEYGWEEGEVKAVAEEAVLAAEGEG